jgi:hypothetical protein
MSTQRYGTARIFAFIGFLFYILAAKGRSIRTLNYRRRRQHRKFSPNLHQWHLILDCGLHTAGLRNILRPRSSPRPIRMDHHKSNRRRKLHASAYEQPVTRHSRLSFWCVHRWRLLPPCLRQSRSNTPATFSAVNSAVLRALREPQTPKRAVLPTLRKRTTPLKQKKGLQFSQAASRRLSQLG